MGASGEGGGMELVSEKERETTVAKTMKADISGRRSSAECHLRDARQPRAELWSSLYLFSELSGERTWRFNLADNKGR